MKRQWFNRLAAVCGVALLAFVSHVASAGDPAGKPANDADRASSTNKAAASKEKAQALSVEVARDRAKVMHELYATTLEVMHHRYFHGDRAIVPARAMEDIFAELERTSQVQARWISVNMKPMSVSHAPKSDFEKRAANELSTEKPAIEVVEDGYYRRARAIPLAAECVSCHAGFFKAPTKTPKFAGLVISIPVETKSTQRD